MEVEAGGAGDGLGLPLPVPLFLPVHPRPFWALDAPKLTTEQPLRNSTTPSRQTPSRNQKINFVAKTPSHQTPSRNQKINFVAKAPSHQTPSRNVRIFFSLQLLRLPTAMSNYVRQIVHDSKNKNTSYSQRHKLSRSYVKSHAPAASIAPPNDCHEWAKTRQSEQRQASLYSASQDRAAV